MGWGAFYARFSWLGKRPSKESRMTTNGSTDERDTKESSTASWCFACWAGELKYFSCDKPGQGPLHAEWCMAHHQVSSLALAGLVKSQNPASARGEYGTPPAPPESRKAKSQQRRFRNRNLPSTRGSLRLGFAAVLSPYQENLPAAFLVHKYIITNNLPPLSLLGRIFSSEPSHTPLHLLSAVKAQGRTDAGGLS